MSFMACWHEDRGTRLDGYVSGVCTHSQGFGSEIQTHAGALSSLFATGFGWRNAHPIDPMTWKERCLGSGSATLLRGNKWLAPVQMEASAL